MIKLRTMQRMLSGCTFWMSSSKDILKSKFHVQGYNHFQKSRRLLRNLTTNEVEIDRTQLLLEKLRIKMGQDRPHTLEELDSEEKGYFQTYQKLIQLVGESRLNEEWFYRIVGWYNLQEFFQQVVEKMMLSSSKNEHIHLVETVCWMDPHLPRPLVSSDFFEVRNQQKLGQNYYKRLNLTHSIPLLRSIESIMSNTTNSCKSKYYSNYVNTNLPKLLKTIRPDDTQRLDELFWLLNTYVNSFNDKPEVMETFQNFLNQQPLKLSTGQIDILMNIYRKIGRIDPGVYQKHIKAHLLGLLEAPIHEIVELFEFIVFSQAEDIAIVNSLLRVIAKTVKKDNVEDSLKHRVHHLVHYLRIKKSDHELSSILAKELDECCRRYEGNGSIARMMAIELDEKGRNDGNTYVISECLRKPRINSPIKQDKGHQVKPDLPFKRYPDIRFCTLDLQNCVVNSQTKQAVLLIKSYTRFEHSKRFLRQFQVKDTILSHYGFKINYMENKEKLKVLPGN